MDSKMYRTGISHSTPNTTHATTNTGIYRNSGNHALSDLGVGAAQARQKSLNRVGDNSVYLTVC